MRRELAAAALVASLAACTGPAATAPPAPPPVATAPRATPPAAPPPRASAAPLTASPAPPGTASPAPPTASSPAAPLTAAPATRGGIEAWKRNHEGLEPTATVQECLGCHEGTSLRVHTSHPVDADYASAAGLAGASLREPGEAQRRGARLPGGKLHCLSCHDPGSPWRSHVALPPGARIRAALVVEESDEGSSQAPATPAPGAAVNTMPLCQACHTYGD